jgi:acyl transferase domain-containing protein
MESERLKQNETAALGGREPVAIIGIGCRFPEIDSAGAFWRVLENGLETVGEYPGGRFSFIDSVYANGSVASRRGGFLREVDGFDASFFGISAREATLLDPQQRLLLEVAWEAFEDAGLPATSLSGSRTGVFVGVWTSDYEDCVYQSASAREFYATTGGGRYPASGRLSYFFDLRGPALTVDTACSSSLVAVHLACQSLWRGESELALAGGANIILRPEVTLAYSAAGMLSPEGRSKFGDAAANGYVRSEGAGIVILKPLARALADGDSIYALIRGGAVNNDGRSCGQLIAPSRVGQEAVLRDALRDAATRPEEIGYVEAHGTGTTVGDPIEIETIGRVMAGTYRARPCAVGSVKTNIGHTESAAGAAGLIKVALSLKHGVIPASLHFKEPNPAIQWDAIPVRVQDRAGAWPDGEKRLAGVSAFGITGTNAHIILENAPEQPSVKRDEAGPHLFLLSANSGAALDAVARGWLDRLKADARWPSSLADLAFTAARRRTQQEYRLAVTAGSREELAEQLGAWLAKEPREGMAAGRARTARRRVAFIFPGQGGQWGGMCCGLMRDEPAFLEALRKCDAAIRAHVGWSVMEKLAAAGELTAIDEVQPCLFAVMVALAALWRSWGVEPEAVVGHSMGECAAAAVSGALSVEDAAAVICHRSALMKRASGKGAMAVAELSLDDALAAAADYGGSISVAAHNSPTSSVFSGDAGPIEDLLGKLERREVFCRRIKVEVASHCAHMDPLRPELVERLRGIAPRAGRAPLYSTTTGALEDGSALNAEYWGRNLRSPVLFSEAVQSLLADGLNAFVEINAHPVLQQAVEAGIRIAEKDAIVAASLRRDRDERTGLLAAAGALHVNGVPMDVPVLFPRGECLRLPAYPWQRERYWVEDGGAPSRAFSDGAGCIYHLRWKPVALPAAQPAAQGVWVLYGEPGGLAERCAEHLRGAGEEFVFAADAEAARRALEAAGALCRGALCDPFAEGDDPAQAVRGVEAAARLAQALASARASAAPRLWLLSAGAWSLPDDTCAPSVAQGAAWGLGRVIAREHPELRCVNVDLGSAPGGADFATLVKLLRGDGPEEQLAIRGDRCFAARFERGAAAADGPVVFSSEATYLITGGMGGMGLQTARWLVARGARHLALMGRRPPSEEALRVIEELRAGGAEARTFAADAAEGPALAAALETIAREMPPLDGLFHLAVVTDSELILALTRESLERVMRPKAMAAWALHRCTRHLPLRHFVMASSVAAAISQPGQGSYAAANACLDALARKRRAEGLPALSIQWGPWSQTGLAGRDESLRTRSAYADQGIRAMEPAACFAALESLMKGAEDALVLNADWGAFGQHYGAAAPRATVDLLPAKSAPETPRESIREKLAAFAPGRERRAVMETYVSERLAAVLRTRPANIDAAKPMGAMGVDSLLALELARRLAADTGVKVPATAVFNYPTVERLSAELAGRMGLPLEAADAAPERTAAGASSAILDTLTDEEALCALRGARRRLM